MIQYSGSTLESQNTKPETRVSHRASATKLTGL